jgi:hypothetical protein
MRSAPAYAGLLFFCLGEHGLNDQLEQPTRERMKPPPQPHPLVEHGDDVHDAPQRYNRYTQTVSRWPLRSLDEPTVDQTAVHKSGVDQRPRRTAAAATGGSLEVGDARDLVGGTAREGVQRVGGRGCRLDQV